VLLNEVYAQDQGFIEVCDNIEFMLQEFGANSNMKFVSASYCERLTSSSFKPGWGLIFQLDRSAIRR